VCFDDAGVCEIFVQQRGGTHVPAGDEVAFARAVRAYLRDPQLMAAARSVARTTAEPLDIANVYHTFANVIERVGMTRAASAPSSEWVRAAQGASSTPR
jgi:glycosyltransferase involved in cell wall biosynthesis